MSRPILEEHHREMPDGRELTKILTTDERGHRYWKFATRVFYPSPGDGPTAGTYGPDANGFNQAASSAERFERALAEACQVRALDPEPLMAAEDTEFRKLAAAFPLLGVE